MNRLQLDPFLSDKKSVLKQLFANLQKQAGQRFYASVWAEIRSKNSLSQNLNKLDINESNKAGVVLRLYDGQTLFEEATDSFDFDELSQCALNLLERARSLSEVQSQVCAYQPTPWKDRLLEGLDNEIQSQIPKQLNSDTWVHFGTGLHIALFANMTEASLWVSAEFEKLKIELKDLDADYLGLSLSLQEDHFIFLDSEVSMTQSLCRNMSRAVAMKGQESARVDRGGLGGKESFQLEQTHYKKLKEQLKDLLKCERLTPGRYKVVMGPAVTGVFAHEAFGHTQEGDTWARGRSKAKELFHLNTRVGNDHATIVNNPAIFKNGLESSGAWGSYFFDEEGWLSKEQVLVEKGFLKPPMTHLLSSQQLNIARSANGKRENWSHGIYTRQTNTYFSAGDKSLKQLIEQVDYGFLAEECAGGMEDPKGMGIQVGIQYVKEIKDGKLTGKCFHGPGGGSLQMTGSVPEYLNLIIDKSAIDPEAKETAEHPFNDVGGCAKYHKEVVYAGCGGPYMLVDKVLLG